MTAEDWQAVDESALAFADWLADATVSGGCTPDLDYGTPAAPAACGGSVTVNFEITDYCLETPITGSATFTVPVPADIVYNFPMDMTADDCQTQADIDLAFAEIGRASRRGGGCTPELDYGTPAGAAAGGGDV